MIKKILSGFFIFSLAFIIFSTDANALGTVTKISNTSNDVINPVTVADSDGYLHVVWQELTPGQVWTAVNPGIYYSRWNGDTWSTPIKISENTGFASTPSIAVDSNDTVHVVWDDESYAGDGLPVVVHKTRSSIGTWSAIETLTRPSGTIAARFSRVAINSSNEPNIFFTANTDGNKDSIYWTRFTAGAWTTPELISKNASGANIIDSQWVDVKDDDAGNIHLVYWSFTQSLYYRKLTNNTFTAPFQVNTSGNMESTRLGATPAGEVFITWYQIFDTSINVRWTQGGVWQNPVVLTTAGQRSNWGYPIMGVTTDSKERAHVGWGEKDVSDNLIDLKYRTFTTGSWGSVQDVDLNNNDADTPFVYPDVWDNQHFMWVEKKIITPAVVCPPEDELCVPQPAVVQWELFYRVAEGTIQSVTTAGGTVTANPFNVNQVTLTIPSGALSATEQIAIQVGPVPENVSPTQVTIPKAYTFRPDGLTFSTPVTARIFYTNAEVAGADENLLQPWVWDSLAATWSAQTVTSRNTAQNRMDISLNHFSLYGISAPRVVVEWKKPTDKAVKKGSLDYSFEMRYASGDNMILAQDPETLKVLLKNSDGDTILTQRLEKKGVEQHGKDKFDGKMDIKNYPSGNYSLELYLNDSLMSVKNVAVE